MDLLRIPELQALEAREIERAGPGVLMQRAARAVARWAGTLLRTLPAQGAPACPWVLVCMGPGNNGGDALQAGLLLADRGHRVVVLDLFETSTRPTDAAAVWQAAKRSSALSWWTLEETLDWLAASCSCGLVLDGLFGIGLRCAIEGPSARLIKALNGRDAGRIQVLSVDLPSGLGADTGQPVEAGPVVRADLTLTLLANKPGLHTGEASRWCGHIVLDAIGIQADAARTLNPAQAIDTPGPAVNPPHAIGTLFDEAQARTLAPRRARDAHKGRFGDLLVIQGAPSTQGAALLALLGAQAVGTGRLYLGQDTLAAAPAFHPEFMSREVRPDALGSAQTIVLGCGLGQDARARAFVQAVLALPQPRVLDADALNLLAQIEQHDSKAGAASAASAAPAGIDRAIPSGEERSNSTFTHDHRSSKSVCVMTPHPLEAARLLGCSVQAVQADRIRSAQDIAQRHQCTVVLKGAGTVVADPEGTWSINASGGPLLSVAGTGDVLAGVIGGLLAQGLSAPQAARLGVWLHGAAADALSAQPAWAAGIGLPASRLAEAIRERLNRLAAPDARCAD